MFVVYTCGSYVKNFLFYRTKLVFKFKSSSMDMEVMEWIKRGLEKLFKQMTENTTDEDKLEHTLISLNFKNRESGYDPN